LTPSTQKRALNGLYPFEVAVDTREQRLRKETFQASVVIGPQTYPMQQTLGLANRYETLVPISPDREYVNYRFKLDYEYKAIPESRPGSKLSPPFQLHIVDK
jgi:hypothetical protein